MVKIISNFSTGNPSQKPFPCNILSAWFILAAAGSGYRVLSVDTKHVSVGQAAVVIEAARLLREHPELTPELLGAAAERIAAKTHMCFVPQNLDYLRAGGRVSNAAALISGVLNLH